MSKIVSIHPSDLALTASDFAELRRVAEMPDSAIDYSDIPPTTDVNWSDAVHSRLYRPVKKQVTLRIDSDVLAWARKQSSRGYQSRLNAILREAMLRDLGAKSRSV